MKTVELTVTTGMNLSVERYNSLVRAEPYLRLMEEGWVDLWLVSYDNSIRITIPNHTTIAQVRNAAMSLMPVPTFGGDVFVRDRMGQLLESNRPVSEFGFTYGERLFIGG
jgi:hypothetical protein